MADAGVLMLVLTTVAIIAGGIGTWAVHALYHPPGEQNRMKNRPPEAQ